MKLVPLLLCSILIGSIMCSISLFSVVEAAESSYFEDDFETNNLTAWDGYRSTSGETIGTSSYRSYLGAYSGRITSNGDSEVEYSYCYEKFSSSYVEASAAFYVAKSGIIDENDRIYLISLQSGHTTLATMGWRKINGQIKWFLLLNGGTEWIIDYSEESPKLNYYYVVQLTWQKDTQNGWATLSIGTDNYNFHPICSITNKNTAEYGDVSEVRVGLPTISYCDSTAIYFDNAKISTSHSPVLIYELSWYMNNFEDNFETNSFDRWSGTKAYNGGTSTVTDGDVYSGNYAAEFTTDGSTNYGQTYCYKNIYLPDVFLLGNTIRFDVAGMFKVTDCDIDERGRVYLIREWSEGSVILGAGLEKIDGNLKWFISRKDGTEMVTSYSENIAELDSWNSLNLAYYPYVYPRGGSANWCFLVVSSADGSVEYISDHGGHDGNFPLEYNLIDRIDVGLVRSDNCYATSMILDNFYIFSDSNE